mgnify:CR=1 FL=1
MLAALPVAGAALTPIVALANGDKPALLGGTPARTGSIPSWPVFDSAEETGLINVLRSGKWGRGGGQQVNKFEAAYAQFTGARGCLTTVNGTNALYTSLNTLGVEPGDEVLIPPFTFVATVNVVLRQHALPVFVDSDLDTFQIDARKMEPLINERTKAVIPVHLGGNPADMDTVMSVARKHNLIVIEDACQAWVAQWRGRNVGRIGNCGCFSFQASKNINAGEGGAIISDDEDFIERCFGFHTQGRMRKLSDEFSYSMSGSNLRMTEFQAAVLLAQLSRLDALSKKREENAAYLSNLLKEIPGIVPARMYAGCTRNAYHLYMLRFEPEKFAGMPRAKFLKAVNAEGVPLSGGYGPLNRSAFLKSTFQSRGYRRLFPAERIARWEEQNQTPVNDRMTREVCWMSQNSLLAERGTMNQFAEGIRKVQKFAAEINRA